MAKAPPATKTRPKRSYSKVEIGDTLAKLTSNGGNLLRTSRETGIPRQTIQEWANNGVRDDPEVQDIRHQKERHILELYSNAERDLLDHAMKPEIIADMDGLAAMKAAGIARDKIQILTGQPTSIIEERSLDSRQILVLIQESYAVIQPGAPLALPPAES